MKINKINKTALTLIITIVLVFVSIFSLTLIKENSNYKKSPNLVPVSCVKDEDGKKLGCFYNNVSNGDLECALFKPYMGKATIGCGSKKD